MVGPIGRAAHQLASSGPWSGACEGTDQLRRFGPMVLVAAPASTFAGAASACREPVAGAGVGIAAPPENTEGALPGAPCRAWRVAQAGRERPRAGGLSRHQHGQREVQCT